MAIVYINILVWYLLAHFSPWYVSFIEQESAYNIDVYEAIEQIKTLTSKERQKEL